MYDLLIRLRYAVLIIFFTILIVNIKICSEKSKNPLIPERKIINKEIYYYIAENNLLAKEGEFTNVYYEEDDEEISSIILNMSDLYYPIICSEMKIDGKDDKTDIIVFNTKKKFADILGIDEKNVPMGAYFGGFINILNPKLWIDNEEEIIDRFMNEGPVIHEIAHLVLDKKLKGNYDLWFSEGVALFFENRFTGYEWRKDLSEKCKNITYKDLKNNFSYLDESLAYRRSYEIIRDIGYENLIEMIDELQKGRNFDTFFESLYQELL